MTNKPDQASLLVRLPRDVRDRFKVLCAQRKTNMSAMIAEYIAAVLDVTPKEDTK